MGKHTLQKTRNFPKLYRTAGVAIAIPLIGLGSAAASLADTGTEVKPVEQAFEVSALQLPEASNAPALEAAQKSADTDALPAVEAAITAEVSVEDSTLAEPLEGEETDPPVIPPVDPPIDPTDPPVIPPVDPPIDPTDPPVTPPVDPPVTPPVTPRVAPVVVPTVPTNVSPELPQQPAIQLPGNQVQVPVRSYPVEGAYVPVANTTQTQAGQQLANTGADGTAIAILGAGGIALGSGAMLVAKRRSKPKHAS
ncbi:LPXTG-motif cell wall anchor domain-containing protein [Arthrobacter alpinus]|uniref:LPXTG-motif cell wall anchor domain-containing protein n=1 Tax=Arthrobacter alpinus TaxID=656366 RepID=A0A1H5PFU3_9MICC|nr:LPXTG cell wall anchor domain-containing protein [Arthrobacter alpinus]SEF11988.1 LPXTG-motif cell wall anchor domain-containing protein [Arthrobacter alpinus]